MKVINKRKENMVILSTRKVKVEISQKENDLDIFVIQGKVLKNARGKKFVEIIEQ